MSLLTRQDWEKLRNEYRAAFTTMSADMFKLLLDKVYGKSGNPSPVSIKSASHSGNPGKLDQSDALMIYLASITEPPIVPPRLR